MLGKIASIASSFRNNSRIKKYNNLLKKINNHGDKLRSLTDDELRARAHALREGSISGDDLLIESFAVCREAGDRILGMRHYDVQIIGGLVLSDGKIAEMKTGEGKTLAATLTVFYKSLEQEQVHLITANEYLATRDQLELKPLYDFLGVKSSAFRAGMTGREKQAIYNECDVIYSTSSEFAFDYLRDNTSIEPDHILQKGHIFAIIDEVDSILIDEARSPLIVSGEGQKDENMVAYLNKIANQFSKKWFDEKSDDPKGVYDEDLIIYEKNKSAVLTDNGFDKLEQILVDAKILPYEGALYEAKNLYVIDRFIAAVKGLFLYNKDVDYVVANGEVTIINQQTGRLESGKRWSDGLHQVIEMKEGVDIKPENTSIASTTLQNYFRLYLSLSGMTGTATSDAEEFMSVYGLEIVPIPTNKPMIRNDERDRVYMSIEAKNKAIVEETKVAFKAGRPVLIGTSSVEESEVITDLLKKEGLAPNVLNAKNHLKEADIIAQAGMPKTITIATNMAGRGTDILLGGNLKSWIDGLANKNEKDEQLLKQHWETLNKQVIEAGGLQVIGTSRNESGRVDNQLKGRAGRQGDPGSTVFFVSMEDNLMRLFGGERFINLFKSLGIKEDECVSHKMIDKGILESQSKVEEHNAKVRRELLKYDDVINIQRSHIYETRGAWLGGNPGVVDNVVSEIVEDVLTDKYDQYMPKGAFEETWDIDGLAKYIEQNWSVTVCIDTFKDDDYLDDVKIRKSVTQQVLSKLDGMIQELPEDIFEKLARKLMVASIDKHWHEQITSLDQLKQAIHLRGYANKDPLMEFKKEALSFFEEMMVSIKEEFAAALMLSLLRTIEANKEETPEDNKNEEALA